MNSLTVNSCFNSEINKVYNCLNFVLLVLGIGIANIDFRQVGIICTVTVVLILYKLIYQFFCFIKQNIIFRLRKRLINDFKVLQRIRQSVNKVVVYGVAVSVLIQINRHSDIKGVFFFNISFKAGRVCVFNTVFNLAVSVQIINSAYWLGLNRSVCPVGSQKNKIPAISVVWT